MGWSCAAAASDTLKRFTDWCVAAGGHDSQNMWTARGGKTFFLEASNVEHRDGAITGTIMRMLPDNRCKRSSDFRIEPDGRVFRGPAALKECGAS